MKSIVASALYLLVSACSSSSKPTPDAAEVHPVHEVTQTGCDPGWADVGESISCQAGCIAKPDCTSLGARFGKPCDNKPACPDATDRDAAGAIVGPVMSCSSTMIANDGSGGHLGCCIATEIPATHGVNVTFYECP